MLTNHSEQTYSNISDCIIQFTHLILGWKYVVHSRLTKFVAIYQIVTVNMFSRKCYSTIDRTLTIIVFVFFGLIALVILVVRAIRGRCTFYSTYTYLVSPVQLK